MATITLREATTLPREHLAAVLRDAFADGAVPADFSVATLDAMIARDDILLDRSLVAWLDETHSVPTHSVSPVGAALVAMRPWRGGTRWRLATLGVVPSARRDGVGRALLDRIVADVRAGTGPGPRRGWQPRGRELVLEVLAGNTAARALYDRCGFVERRRLLGFTLPGASLPRGRLEGISLRPIDGVGALPLFAACTAGETPAAAPPWQVEAPSLARLGPSATVYAIVVTEAASPVGYLALGQGRPAARLLHLGILPAWRHRGLDTAALAAALTAHRDIAAFSVAPLVPASSTLVPFLEARGATRDPIEQVEMALDLG